MTEITGSARLRRAIENQASAGEASFLLPIDKVLAICDEVEDELAQLVWAKGIPAPVDADGNVVPLTTKVMYTNRGQKIELGEFYMLYSVLRDGFVWRSIRHIDHDIEDWKLDCLHLHRPDNWERLKEDVKKSTCEYFGHKGKPCLGCPAEKSLDCIDERAKDIISRAKALEEAD